MVMTREPNVSGPTIYCHALSQAQNGKRSNGVQPSESPHSTYSSRTFTTRGASFQMGLYPGGSSIAVSTTGAKCAGYTFLMIFTLQSMAPTSCDYLMDVSPSWRIICAFRAASPIC